MFDLGWLSVPVFDAFSHNRFHGSISYKTGRLTRTIVQGAPLFNVIGQENCEQMK